MLIHGFMHFPKDIDIFPCSAECMAAQTPDPELETLKASKSHLVVSALHFHFSNLFQISCFVQYRH